LISAHRNVKSVIESSQNEKAQKNLTSERDVEYSNPEVTINKNFPDVMDNNNLIPSSDLKFNNNKMHGILQNDKHKVIKYKYIQNSIN